MSCWAGVDVGGTRKGFDAAVIDDRALVAGPSRFRTDEELVAWLGDLRPCVVAVDSPRRPASNGTRSRECEREFVRSGICGLRYTPNRDALDANRSYYDWILRGFDLYAALDREADTTPWQVIECFPTATWTRLGGARNGASRAAWSQRVLEELHLEGLPPRMNQDARDAIGAAITARLYAQPRETQSFGEIVVPANG